MAVNNKKFKKIPHYLALASLTIGASLILGFLSFGGMYALYPVLSLSFATFGLSVAYEGEVYLQNIKGAFKKLFKSKYLENYLAKEFLQEILPEITDSKECPQFFRDYQTQLNLLNEFNTLVSNSNNKPLNKDSRKRKKQIEKTLSDMEKWFALQLFATKNKKKQEEEEELSDYTKSLRDWLEKHGQKECQERLEKRKSTFNFVKGFSLLTATFMGLGSTYLIVEAFSVIPFMAVIPFAFWPILIVPMAVIAGAAYGMLTYNTITDLINNDTIKGWYIRLRDDLSKGLTARNVFMAAVAVFLVGLAIALTICTAGTWWTVATSARPLFEWMTKIPSFVMGVINPIITGLSSIFFNVENSAESLEMVYDATEPEHGCDLHLMSELPKDLTKYKGSYIFCNNNANDRKNLYYIKADGMSEKDIIHDFLQFEEEFNKINKQKATLFHLSKDQIKTLITSNGGHTPEKNPNIFQRTYNAISDELSYAWKTENWLQRINLFRILLKLTITPLRILLFLGHLVSVALTSDRMPGVPQIVSVLVAIICEGFEDAHYFFDPGQNVDIPTQLLKTLALPLYFLAAGWEYLASKMNSASSDTQPPQPKVLTFTQAWNKQRGIQEEIDVSLPQDRKGPSKEWQVEHTVSLIEKYERKNLETVWVGTEIADAKREELKQLKTKVRATTSNGSSLNEVLKEAKNNPVYNQHRLFTMQEDEKTATQEFIEELPERVHAI